MIEKEPENTAYLAGVGFYERKIEGLREKLITIDNEYEYITVQEEVELSTLKLDQLNRRARFGLMEKETK